MLYDSWYTLYSMRFPHLVGYKYHIELLIGQNYVNPWPAPLFRSKRRDHEATQLHLVIGAMNSDYNCGNKFWRYPWRNQGGGNRRC